MFGRRNQPHMFWAFLGPFFGLGAAILIFWNESHALRTANSLTEGAASVTEAKADRVDPNLEGKLIHLTGETTSDETLRDPQFGVQTPGLRLTRVVEVCESTQEKHSLDSNTSTKDPDGFKAGWRDLSTAASAQRQSNPNNALASAYPPMSYPAATVRVGVYQLGQGLLSQITDATPLVLTAETVHLPAGAYLLPSGQIYLGADPDVPHVGDLRITEKVTPLGPVSVVAAQRADQLVPYLTKAGGDVALVQRGIVNAPEMLTSAQSANHALAWVLRVLGFIGLAVGIRCIISPLSRVASFVPVLGTVLTEAALLVSLLGALVVWSLLVSVAWMAARPLVGLGMLAVVGIGGWLLVKTLHKRPAVR